LAGLKKGRGAKHQLSSWGRERKGGEGNEVMTAIHHRFPNFSLPEKGRVGKGGKKKKSQAQFPKTDRGKRKITGSLYVSSQDRQREKGKTRESQSVNREE